MADITYTVIVKTGDSAGAGTDANVYLTLYGENGKQTSEMCLFRSAAGGNLFEKDSTDIFFLRAPNIGKLSKMRLRHDDKWAGSAWEVQYLNVEIGTDCYPFLTNRWLDSSKGLSVELEVSGSIPVDVAN